MSKHLSFKNTEIFYDKSSNNIKTKHILSTPLREVTNLQPKSNNTHFLLDANTDTE